jgi:hypothetical protein
MGLGIWAMHYIGMLAFPFGIEAVDACRDVDYGIVLMDDQMPEIMR